MKPKPLKVPITVWLEIKDADALRRRAKRAKQPVSEVAREILKAWLRGN